MDYFEPRTPAVSSVSLPDTTALFINLFAYLSFHATVQCEKKRKKDVLGI